MKKNSKPLAVIITDTHMTDKNIALVKDIFKQTFEYCKNEGIKYIFHGGDWFTSRTGQSIACLMATKEILESMHREYGLEMWAIAGNHDKADQSIPESFLSIFEDRPGFRLILLGGGVPFEEYGINVNLLPFFTNDVYEDELVNMNAFLFETPEGYNPKIKQILITHVAVNGVRNNDGTKVTQGVSQNAFACYDSVFVGHYHNKSDIGRNVHYIGSAYQANFGEDNKKGLTVLYSDGTFEQVKLKFPEYIKFSVNVKDLDAATILDIKNFREENPENVHRIILTGSEQEINAFDKTALMEAGVSVEKKPNDVELLEGQEDIEVVSYNKDNILEAFEEFSKAKKIKDNSYGIEIIKRKL